MYIAPNPTEVRTQQWKEEKESTIPDQQRDEEESSNEEPESTIPYAEPQEEVETYHKEEEQKGIPVKGTVKWEKERNSDERARTSTRVTKKPERWGNNVMVKKIEEASNTENESLPSVFEIANPNLKK